MAGLWLNIPEGGVAHIHLPDNRACWRDNTGKRWWMEFHNYCGPTFSTDPDFYDDYAEPPPEIWQAFEGWHAAVKQR